jgi:hypothetical protein
MDDDDTGWEGAGPNDRAEIHWVLEEIMTMPAWKFENDDDEAGDYSHAEST